MPHQVEKCDRIKLILPQGADIPMLKCIIDVPWLEENSAFNRFYNAVAENCAAYCKGELLAVCANLCGDTPRPFTYRLTCRVSHGEEDVTVRLRASLCESVSRRTVASHSETHIWRSGKYVRIQKQKPPR